MAGEVDVVVVGAGLSGKMSVVSETVAFFLVRRLVKLTFNSVSTWLSGLGIVSRSRNMPWNVSMESSRNLTLAKLCY